MALMYVFLRLIRLDITYDEAWTLEAFVPLNFINILNYTPCDANNHILNTLLIKVLYLSGFKSLIIARLPNFFAFTIYLLFSFKISKFLPNTIGLILFFLLLINPFLLDFFSLARGYGLGICFQTASIFYLFVFLKDCQLKYTLYSNIAASCASLANFSQLNYWVALIFTLAIIILCCKKINKIKFIVYNSIVAIIFLLIIYEPIRKLVKGGNLYYGGSSNFYSDTLVSLTKYTQYSPNVNQYTYLFLNIFLIALLVGTSFLLINNLRKKINFFKIENSIFLIVSLPILSPIIQHYLLGTLYLIDRTALFYYPLLILLLCFTLNLFQGVVKNIVLAIATFIFCLNFTLTANLYKTAIWYFDSHTKDILAQINKSGANQNKVISTDFSWPFQSSIYYYLDKNEYPYINIVKNKRDREEISPNAEYYIYLNKSLEKVGYEADKQKVLSFKRDTLFYYEKEGIYVLRKINDNIN